MKAFLRSKRVWVTTGLILLIAILFVIFVDLEEVFHLLQSAEWGWLAAAGTALLGGYITFAVRWRSLLARRPSLARTFHAANASQMVNVYSPIPGIPIRILLVSDGKLVTIPQATSSSIVERILEQIMRLSALGGALFLGAGVAGAKSTIAGGLGLIIIALALIALALRDPQATQVRLAGWINRLPFLKGTHVEGLVGSFMAGLKDAGSPKQFVIGWLWSLLMWSLFLLFHLFGLLALDLGLPWQVTLGISLSALAVVPPSAPAMPGTYHASLVAVLALLTNLDGATLTAYAILLHIIQMVCLSALGVWALTRLDLSLGEIIRTSSKQLAEETAGG